MDREGESQGDLAAGERFEDWRSVGCGVESLHHLLNACGVEASLDEVLQAALAHDGYDEAVGWRHRALVEAATGYGIPGDVRSGLTAEDLADGLWLISVNAPEQFDSTHLVAVRAVDDCGENLRIYWPQGQLEHGERFTVPRAWLGERMTGRGMRFEGRLAPR